MLASRSALLAAALALSAACSSVAHADIVFLNTNDNGFFAPFNSANAATVTYGDSGWIHGPDSPPYAIDSITLSLCVFDSEITGSTDLAITFNDGDPSGLVFGSGQQLYSTVVQDVELPATGDEGVIYFDVTVPIPNILTRGGYNNIGWSVKCQNFNSDGSFGFAVATASSQTLGFYTNNASFHNGTSWSLFAFSQDPNTGVANFVATITGVEYNCPCNFDNTLGTTADDIFAYLDVWFAQTGQTGTNLRADVNGSGSVTADDIFAFLDCWFNPPSGCNLF